MKNEKKNHILEPGYGEKTEMWKMRHKHCMNWNMARNTEKHEKWKNKSTF
jgi:hypothetical protein